MHARRALLCGCTSFLCVLLLGTLAPSVGQQPATAPASTQPATAPASAQPLPISGPYAHENLAVYLVHGRDQLKGRDFLTLDDALKQNKAKLYETGEVGELMIENLSEKEVFVQAGDIVCGGQQDRMIAVDLILAAESGRVPLKSFCVEAGRWNRRGNESSAYFSSSSNAAPSNELKLAARQQADQRAVWTGVANAQRRLSTNLGKSVASRASETSLELSLENEDLRKQTAAYTNDLSKKAAGKDNDDVIGLVIAINGQVESADLYASPKLFRKLWPKLLEAGATEAIAAKSDKPDAKSATPPTVQAVRDFLTAKADKAQTTQVSRRIRSVTRESRATIMYGLDVDLDGTAVPLHSSHLRKTEPPPPDRQLQP